MERHKRSARKTHDHKEHWNAAAAIYLILVGITSPFHVASRSSRDRSCGAHSGHFDFDRQIVLGRLQLVEREDEDAASWLQM